MKRKMKDLELDLKSKIVTLRWLTVLLVSLLMFYSQKSLAFGSGAYLLAANLFLSNVLLAFLPRDRFEKPTAFSLIMLMDVAFVTLAIYMTSGFNTDFYLVYFLIIFIAAMRQELRGSILAGVIAIVFYGWLVHRSSVGLQMFETPFVIRAGFLLLAAAFSGVLAQGARKHEEAKGVAKELAQSKARLEEWNLLLESEVKKRTDELENAQEKLIRSERLATIGQLAASVGHELRNPLGVLQNSLYYLTLKLNDSEDKVKKHLTTMSRELSRSDKIIAELLEYSRKREPCLHPTDLNRLMDEVLEKVAVPGEVRIARESDDLPPVAADSEQLQSVFLNLIYNGIQAMPEGGTLTLKTSRENGSVEVRVSDTGGGIPEENLQKIFEPLFTTKSKGIGLGLSITKNIVESHGGEMKVESELNEGATFIVRLPESVDRS
jgi:signal transduction histidine kinase